MKSLVRVRETRSLSILGKLLVLKEGKAFHTRLFLLTHFSFRIPDTSKVRQKMLYASSKDALRRQLVGIAIEVQGTDASEVCYEVVLEKANRSA